MTKIELITMDERFIGWLNCYDVKFPFKHRYLIIVETREDGIQSYNYDDLDEAKMLINEYISEGPEIYMFDLDMKLEMTIKIINEIDFSYKR